MSTAYCVNHFQPILSYSHFIVIKLVVGISIQLHYHNNTYLVVDSKICKVHIDSDQLYQLAGIHCSPIYRRCGMMAAFRNNHTYWWNYALSYVDELPWRFNYMSADAKSVVIIRLQYDLYLRLRLRPRITDSQRYLISNANPTARLILRNIFFKSRRERSLAELVKSAKLDKMRSIDVTMIVCQNTNSFDIRETTCMLIFIYHLSFKQLMQKSEIIQGKQVWKIM